MRSKPELIRVVSNEGLQIDKNQKLPGRGAYVCRSGSCIAKAQKSKGLERSFKGRVQPEIYAQLTAEVER